MQAFPNDFATFVEILQSRARSHPEQRAFVFLDGRLAISDQKTFAELDSCARVIASELVARDLAGHRILLIYPPGLDFVAALFGCFYAGCIAVPAPSPVAKGAGARIDAIYRDCEPAAVLTVSWLHDEPEVRSSAVANAAGLVWLPTDTIEWSARAEIASTIRPDQLALLQYTSGSTSAPKGVMLTHANLIANSAMIRDAFQHDATSRMVSWLPLFHDMGLIGHVLQPVYVGGLSVLMSPLTFLRRPLAWPQAVSEWQATSSGGPTSGFDLCSRLVRSEQAQLLDLRTWRVAYCGSEKVHASVLERFAERFAPSGFRPKALYPCYGLAEATLFVTGGMAGSGMKTISTSLDQDDAFASTERIVSCGRPWRDQTIAIVDPDTGKHLADGTIGEIWLEGPNVARGYWRKDSAGRICDAMRTSDAGAEYLRTGDLGFVQQGELFVVGRLKDVINIRGFNHAPEDIEISVAASHPIFAARPQVAFGIEQADQELLVIVQEIARSVQDRDEQNRGVEAAFKQVTRQHGLRVHDFVLVRSGTIPRTSSGKLKRQECRGIYLTTGFERLNAPTDLHWLGANRNSGGN